MKRTEIPIGTEFHRLKTICPPYVVTGRAGTVIDVECYCGVIRDGIRTSQLLHGKLKSCGCLRRDQLSKRPRLYRFHDHNGYIIIPAPDEHPNARKSGAILEHILVMTEELGRPLTGDENVHHKNGVRDDNRIENLELWSYSQPPGQRVLDKVKWALEILRKYDPDQFKEAA